MSRFRLFHFFPIMVWYMYLLVTRIQTYKTMARSSEAPLGERELLVLLFFQKGVHNWALCFIPLQIAGGDGARQPHAKELDIANHQGKSFGTILNQFVAGKWVGDPTLYFKFFFPWRLSHFYSRKEDVWELVKYDLYLIKSTAWLFSQPEMLSCFTAFSNQTSRNNFPMNLIIISYPHDLESPSYTIIPILWWVSYE